MKKNLFRHISLSSLIVFCWMIIIICIGAYSFLTTNVGARIIVHGLLQSYAPYCDFKIGSFAGTIEKGLVLKDVIITNISAVKGATLHIQELDVQVPLVYRKKFFARISNAKLKFLSSDSIVFDGEISDDQIRGNCYASSIDVKEVVKAFGYDALARDIYGFISHIDFYVSGLVQSPKFSGHFIIDRFTYKNSTHIKDGFGHLDLAILSLGEVPLMQGPIVLESALVKTEQINIDLSTSKADFKGLVTNPTLDIHGSSKVGDALIDMAIKGTLLKPQLLLSSDPPMSEEEIIATLISRGWSGIGTERSQGFGLRKKLTDSFNVGMKFEEKPEQLGQTRKLGYSKTIQGQMNLTDKFSFNVARKYLPTDGAASPSVRTSQQAEKDDETDFFLQYKQRF